MKKLGHWWYFMSPVSGQLVATEQLPQIPTGYIWIGNLLGEPQSSPAFIDMQLDMIEIRHLIDDIQITIPPINATYILRKNTPLLTNSQSLESLGQDGLLKTVNDSLEIAIPDEDYVDPATYREEVEKLEGEINELQQELQFLTSSFYSIKNTYDLLKAAILVLESDIINIEGWKKDIEEEISFLDARIAEIEALLYEVLRQLRILYLEVAAVVEQCRKYAEQAQISAENSANSASDAKDYRDQAKGYRDGAEDYADDAGQSATSAALSVAEAAAYDASSFENAIAAGISAASAAAVLATLIYYNNFYQNQGKSYAQQAQLASEDSALSANNAFIDTQNALNYSNSSRDSANDAEQTLVSVIEAQSVITLLISKVQNSEINIQVLIQMALDAANQAEEYLVSIKEFSNIAVEAKYSASNDANLAQLAAKYINSKLYQVENLFLESNINIDQAKNAAAIAEQSVVECNDYKNQTYLLTEKAKDSTHISLVNAQLSETYSLDSYNYSLSAEEFSNSAYLSQINSHQDALLVSKAESTTLVYTKNAYMSENICANYAIKTEDEYCKAEQAAIRAEIAESSILNRKIILDGDVTGTGNLGNTILTSLDKSVLYNFLHQNIRTGTIQIGNVGNFDLGDLTTTGSILTASKALGYTGTNDNIIEITYEDLGYSPIPSLTWSDPTEASSANDINIISVQYIDNTTMKLYISSNSSSAKNGKILITLNSNN